MLLQSQEFAALNFENPLWTSSCKYYGSIKTQEHSEHSETSYSKGYLLNYGLENTNVESLLNLSREYQIQKTKDLCEAYLLRKVPTIDQLIVAQEYDLPLLKDKCLKQLSEKALNGLQDHPRFAEINDSNRLLILEQQLKRLQTYCRKVSQIAHASDMR